MKGTVVITNRSFDPERLAALDLAPTVDLIKDSALDLLDRMIDPSAVKAMDDATEKGGGA